MIIFKLENTGIIEQLKMLPVHNDIEFDSMTTRFSWWIAARLRDQVPVNSGHLRNSIRWEKTGGVGNPYHETKFFAADYFKYLDEGTGKFGPKQSLIHAHGTVMAFAQHGQMWFHPTLNGIKPRKYTDKTFLTAMPEATRHLQEMGERVFGVIK